MLSQATFLPHSLHSKVKSNFQLVVVVVPYMVICLGVERAYSRTRGKGREQQKQSDAEEEADHMSFSALICILRFK